MAKNKIDHKSMSKYVDGKLVQEGERVKDAGNVKLSWWKADEDEMAQQIMGTIKFISHHQASRIDQLVVSTRLYGNSSAFNFIGPALMRSASTSGNTSSNRVSFNLCASVVDTLVSKIAKNKVIPTFVTNGGVWGMQKRAEQLSKFTEGMFYEHDVHAKAVLAFKDACCWGTGILHIYDDDGKPCIERVLPHELLVDQIETLVGPARQMHRVKIADRDVCMAMFQGDTEEDEEAREAIRNASATNYIEMGAEGTAADLITIIESWHLRSSDESDDGVHVICVDDEVLVKQSYEKDYFPFAFINYNDKLLGFWGQGACERLMNLQGEINRLMILDQRSRWMQGSFKILVENGSKIVSQHLNNEVGTIVHYSGTPPQYVTPPAINPDNAAQIDALIAKGFQQEGVSQLAASSLVPLGVKSGAAMRNLDQIGDDRFLFTGQQMETFVLEIARQLIEVAKEIYKTNKKFKVVFPQTTFIETIDWGDIKLKEDEYVMKAYPTSSLPEDPAARLETIQEYAAAGFISPRAARRMMAMPDVEMSDKLANAPENLLHKILEEMCEDYGNFMPPEPTMDLQLAKTLVVQYINYAQLQNAPENIIAKLERFSSEVDDAIGLTQPPPAPVQAPMANPAPAPTSPLIPNQNNQPPQGA